MRLHEWVTDNYHQIFEHFTITQNDNGIKIDPRHVNRRRPSRWQKEFPKVGGGSHKLYRLYIPLSALTNAGYIDLYKEDYRVVPEPFANPSRQETKLRHALKWLKDQCYLEAPLKVIAKRKAYNDAHKEEIKVRNARAYEGRKGR